MSTSVPKAVLYYSPSDVWSAAVRLTLEEKGYSSEEVDLKTVNIVKAENFAPTFLRLSSKGQIPTLVAPLEKTLSEEVESRFKSITDTKALIAFLDKSRSPRSNTHTVSSAPAPSLAPATVAFSATTSAIIDALHDEKITPDALLYASARDAPSLEKLGQQLLPIVTSKKDALSKFLADAERETIKISPKVKSLWQEELEVAQHHLILFSTPTAEQKEEYIRNSIALWEGTVKDVLLKLEKEIAGPFTLGDQISLADLHLVAWLARVVLLAGGNQVDDGNSAVSRIERLCKVELPRTFTASVVEGDNTPGPKQSKLAAFWDAFKARPSWKTVYEKELV